MEPRASLRAKSSEKIHKDGGGGGSSASMTFDGASRLSIRGMEVASHEAEPRVGGDGNPDDAVFMIKDKRSLSTFNLGPTVLDLTHHGHDEGKSSWVSGARRHDMGVNPNKFGGILIGSPMAPPQVSPTIAPGLPLQPKCGGCAMQPCARLAGSLHPASGQPMPSGASRPFPFTPSTACVRASQHADHRRRLSLLP